MFFTITLYGLTAVLLAVSFFPDRKKTIVSLKKAWKSFENILPKFLAIILCVGIIMAALDTEFRNIAAFLFSFLVAAIIGWVHIL